MMGWRRILTAPRRRWRAKGFGIHSPFAFDFVTKALAPKRVATKCHEWNGWENLIYRCAAYLKPERAAVVAPGDSNVTAILKAARGDIEIVDPDSGITPDITIVTDTAGAPLRDNAAAVYIIAGIDRGANRDFWERLLAEAQRGMDFSDYRTGIICRYPHLPRQSFKIAYK